MQGGRTFLPMGSMSRKPSDADIKHQEYAINLNKYKRMIDVIGSTPQYGIELGKVIDSADLDALANALLNIGNYKGTTCQMIFQMIEKEFNTTQENTVMRGNSITTKLESVFCRTHGQDFLRELFGDIVLRLVTDCDLNLATTIMKLNHVHKVTAETRIEENRQRILDVAQEFVDRFTDPSMVELMPPVIRSIAAYTAQHAQHAFPENVLSYLSGFILLRFFNPAIITPETYNMLPEEVVPDKLDRQNLIAITRLLQKLSNQVLSEACEQNDWINPFIEKNLEKMKSFLYQICQDPSGSDPPYLHLQQKDEFLKALGSRNHYISPKCVSFLHNALYNHFHFLLEEFALQPLFTRDGIQVRLDAELVSLMMEIGTPSIALSVHNELAMDLKSSFWDSRRKLPSTITPRFGHTASQWQNKLYLIGGCSVDGELITKEESLLLYNIGTSEWKGLNAKTPSRKFHAAACNTYGIYIFGGIYDQEPQNDMYCFRFNTKKWEPVEYLNDPPHPLYGFTMNIFRKKLFIFGGYSLQDGKYKYSDQLWSFSLETKLWTEIISDGIEVPTVMYHTSILHDDSIWIFGGRLPDLETLSGLSLLMTNEATNEWKKIQSFIGTPCGRWGHTMTLIHNQKFLIFGGSTSTEYFNDLHEFSFESYTWKKLNDSCQKDGISFHSTIEHQQKLEIVFGGKYELTGTLCNYIYLIPFKTAPEPYEKLATDWKFLVNQKQMSDVSIIAENKVIYCHLLVLFVRCPCLYDIAMASESKEIEIAEISYSLLFDLVNYIYTNKIPKKKTLDDVLLIVVWCKRFELVSLLEHFEEHSNIILDNFKQLAFASLQTSHTNLQRFFLSNYFPIKLSKQ